MQIKPLSSFPYVLIILALQVFCTPYRARLVTSIVREPPISGLSLELPNDCCRYDRVAPWNTNESDASLQAYCKFVVGLGRSR